MIVIASRNDEAILNLISPLIITNSKKKNCNSFLPSDFHIQFFFIFTIQSWSCAAKQLKFILMRRANCLIMGIISICLLSGCASVNFYTGSDLTGKTGLKYYNVKPYLLVEPNATKDNSIKTSVIYLPDLANPGYLAIKPGFGSSELKVALTNGSLSSVGLLNESKIPETINSLAALLSKSGYAVTQFSQPGGITIPSSEGPDFKLYEIIIGTTGTSLKEITLIP